MSGELFEILRMNKSPRDECTCAALSKGMEIPHAWEGGRPPPPAAPEFPDSLMRPSWSRPEAGTGREVLSRGVEGF